MNSIELTLRKALQALEPEPRVSRMARRSEKRAGILVEWSVRQKWGGPVFCYQYRAPVGCWESDAKDMASRAITAAGLVPWTFLGTTMPE